MTQKYDGVYDYTKPWRAPVQPDQVAKQWQYNGPWSSNMERLTSQALMVATIPGAEISQMVRPPLPQIRLFPDRYGYDRRAVGIDDVVQSIRHTLVACLVISIGIETHPAIVARDNIL